VTTHTDASQTPTATTASLPGQTQFDVVRGLESYFQFVHNQVEVNREFAIGWVATMSGAFVHLSPLATAPPAKPSVAEHAETFAQDTTTTITSDGDDDACHPAHAKLAETGILGGLIELLVDADIMATAT